MTLELRHPFSPSLSDIDILFRDLFDRASNFEPIFNMHKPSYPMDIIKYDDYISVEITAVGLDKDQIDLDIKNNILHISYAKDKESNSLPENCQIITKGITRRSFNFVYKIDENKIDMENIDAKLEKGLLKIKLPIKKSVKVDSKKIKIK